MSQSSVRGSELVGKQLDENDVGKLLSLRRTSPILLIPLRQDLVESRGRRLIIYELGVLARDIELTLLNMVSVSPFLRRKPRACVHFLERPQTRRYEEPWGASLEQVRMVSMTRMSDCGLTNYSCSSVFDIVAGRSPRWSRSVGYGAGGCERGTGGRTPRDAACMCGSAAADVGSG